MGCWSKRARTPPRGHQPSLPIGEKMPPSRRLDGDQPVEDVQADAAQSGVAEATSGHDQGVRAAGRSRRSAPARARASRRRGRRRRRRPRAARRRCVRTAPRGARPGCPSSAASQPRIADATARGRGQPLRRGQTQRRTAPARRAGAPTSGASRAAMPSASSARPWQSCGAGLVQPRAVRVAEVAEAPERRVEGRRQERQGAVRRWPSTASQPSTRRWSRSTVSARATSSVQYPKAGSGSTPSACCQIPSGPVRASRCCRRWPAGAGGQAPAVAARPGIGTPGRPAPAGGHASRPRSKTRSIRRADLRPDHAPAVVVGAPADGWRAARVPRPAR